MKLFKKRALSVFLTLCMLLTLLPTTALAAEITIGEPKLALENGDTLAWQFTVSGQNLSSDIEMFSSIKLSSDNPTEKHFEAEYTNVEGALKHDGKAVDKLPVAGDPTAKITYSGKITDTGLKAGDKVTLEIAAIADNFEISGNKSFEITVPPVPVPLDVMYGKDNAETSIGETGGIVSMDSGDTVKVKLAVDDPDDEIFGEKTPEIADTTTWVEIAKPADPKEPDVPGGQSADILETITPKAETEIKVSTAGQDKLGLGVNTTWVKVTPKFSEEDAYAAAPFAFQVDVTRTLEAEKVKVTAKSDAAENKDTALDDESDDGNPLLVSAGGEATINLYVEDTTDLNGIANLSNYVKSVTWVETNPDQKYLEFLETTSADDDDSAAALTNKISVKDEINFDSGATKETYIKATVSFGGDYITGEDKSSLSVRFKVEISPKALTVESITLETDEDSNPKAIVTATKDDEEKVTGYTMTVAGAAAANATAKLTAGLSREPVGDETVTVTWEPSDDNDTYAKVEATAGTNQATLTAKAVGRATITAAIGDQAPGVTIPVTIALFNPTAEDNLTVTPSADIVHVGSTVTITVATTDMDDNVVFGDITWKVTGGGTDTLITSGQGEETVTITAPNEVPASDKKVTVQVEATLKYTTDPEDESAAALISGKLTKTTEFEVTDENVLAISLIPTLDLKVNDEETLEATVTVNNVEQSSLPNGIEIQWTSDDSSESYIEVDEGSDRETIVTAKAATLSSPPVTVTATLANSADAQSALDDYQVTQRTADCKVTVTNNWAISLSESSITLTAGQDTADSETITATVTKNGGEPDLPSEYAVTWEPTGDENAFIKVTPGSQSATVEAKAVTETPVSLKAKLTVTAEDLVKESDPCSVTVSSAGNIALDSLTYGLKSHLDAHGDPVALVTDGEPANKQRFTANVYIANGASDTLVIAAADDGAGITVKYSVGDSTDKLAATGDDSNEIAITSAMLTDGLTVYVTAEKTGYTTTTYSINFTFVLTEGGDVEVEHSEEVAPKDDGNGGLTTDDVTKEQLTAAIENARKEAQTDAASDVTINLVFEIKEPESPSPGSAPVKKYSMPFAATAFQALQELAKDEHTEVASLTVATPSGSKVKLSSTALSIMQAANGATKLSIDEAVPVPETAPADGVTPKAAFEVSVDGAVISELEEDPIELTFPLKDPISLENGESLIVYYRENHEDQLEPDTEITAELFIKGTEGKDRVPVTQNGDEVTITTPHLSEFHLGIKASNNGSFVGPDSTDKDTSGTGTNTGSSGSGTSGSGGNSTAGKSGTGNSGSAMSKGAAKAAGFIEPATTVTVPGGGSTGGVGGFTDVPYGYTFATEIAWAQSNGIMGGYNDGTFRPTANTTRQALWMVLARMSGTYPANMAEARTWSINAGVSDGTNGEGNMSRQQFITMLYRYAQMMGLTISGSADLSGFSDSGVVASYAQEAIAWGVANGIITGTTDGRLNPEGTATRAHFAAFVYRFANLNLAPAASADTGMNYDET